MAFFPFLSIIACLILIYRKGWLIRIGGVKAQVATGWAFSDKEGHPASPSSEGSPAMSGRHIHFAAPVSTHDSSSGIWIKEECRLIVT